MRNIEMKKEKKNKIPILPYGRASVLFGLFADEQI